MERPRRPFVLAACRAEADRAALGRCRAAERACLESALFNAALPPSRLNARSLLAIGAERLGVAAPTFIS